MPPRYRKRLNVELSLGLTQRTAHWLRLALRQVKAFEREESAAQATQKTGVKQRRIPKPSGWSDIELVLLSDFSVQFFVNGSALETQTYRDLGLQDARSKEAKPAGAWLTLIRLVRSNGVVARDAKWGKVEKQIQRLRQVLREYARRQHWDDLVVADPLPFEKGRGYQAAFRVRDQDTR